LRLVAIVSFSFIGDALDCGFPRLPLLGVADDRRAV
jgi:hypothetical protein